MGDAYLSEVMVVLEELTHEQTQEAVARLAAAGLEVSRVDDESSVVEGTIESFKVHALKDVPSVRYVRSVFTYDANFPPGDPRDRDGR